MPPEPDKAILVMLVSGEQSHLTGKAFRQAVSDEADCGTHHQAERQQEGAAEPVGGTLETVDGCERHDLVP